MKRLDVLGDEQRASTDEAFSFWGVDRDAELTALNVGSLCEEGDRNWRLFSALGLNIGYEK